MLPVYYGPATPTVNQMKEEGLLVTAADYMDRFDWAPRYYCKNCGIGFPSFSRV
jgi:hypothetical protein